MRKIFHCDTAPLPDSVRAVSEYVTARDAEKAMTDPKESSAEQARKNMLNRMGCVKEDTSAETAREKMIQRGRHK